MIEPCYDVIILRQWVSLVRCGERGWGHFPSITDLFFEADRLNDAFHRKMHAVASSCNGKTKFNVVKRESRALEKVHRAYNGNYLRLTDLVRASLVFKTFSDMTNCLKAISDDKEIAVMPMGGGKMRFQQTDYKFVDMHEYLRPVGLPRSIQMGAKLRGVKQGEKFTDVMN